LEDGFSGEGGGMLWELESLLLGRERVGGNRRTRREGRRSRGSRDEGRKLLMEKRGRI